MTFVTYTVICKKNVAPSITCFQGISFCIQYLAIHTHKPICHTYNYYAGSNLIRFTLSGYQIEDYTTHSCLELHQDADHGITINIIQ